MSKTSSIYTVVSSLEREAVLFCTGEVQLSIPQRSTVASFIAPSPLFYACDDECHRSLAKPIRSRQGYHSFTAEISSTAEVPRISRLGLPEPLLLALKWAAS